MNSIFSFFNLSDDYERRARFAPAVLTLLVFVPTAMALGVPIIGWLGALVGGIGLSAIAGFGLSKISSAVGIAYQNSIFPNWPYDSPTNDRLSPLTTTVSTQQRTKWYQQIKAITGLDIGSVDLQETEEIKQIVNDAITEIRTMLWRRPDTDRLQSQNVDYGFVRNFGGFWVAWLPIAVVNVLVCWTIYFGNGEALSWAVVSTVLFGFLSFYRFRMSKAAVLGKSEHYADSFFSTMPVLIDKQTPVITEIEKQNTTNQLKENA